MQMEVPHIEPPNEGEAPTPGHPVPKDEKPKDVTPGEVNPPGGQQKEDGTKPAVVSSDEALLGKMLGEESQPAAPAKEAMLTFMEAFSRHSCMSFVEPQGLP